MAIAFVLAFLFRTFEAEAFVIPTGSMAPTLMGRHKDVKCQICGYPYQVSASEEVTRRGPAQREQRSNSKLHLPHVPLYHGNRRPQPAALVFGRSHNRQQIFLPIRRSQTLGRDRVLLSRKVRATTTSSAWQACPMKRCASVLATFLSATIRTAWPGNGGDEDFQIARKPPDKLLAMLQIVFDNDYMPAMTKYGCPIRWQSDHGSQSSAERLDFGR